MAKVSCSSVCGWNCCRTSQGHVALWVCDGQLFHNPVKEGLPVDQNLGALQESAVSHREDIIPACDNLCGT
jgi:hypothetical protein